MRMRTTIVLGGIVFLVTACGLVLGYRWLRWWEQQALLAAMPDIGQQIGAQLQADLNATPYGGFAMDCSASCNGETTTVELIFRNKAKQPLKNLSFSAITLEGIKPEETLPMTIAEIQPDGKSPATLHFRNVPWKRINDVNTIYQAGLNINEVYQSTEAEPPREWKVAYTGIPVNLDAESVRRLEEVRAKKR